MKKVVCTLAVMAAFISYGAQAQETGSRHIRQSRVYVRAGLGYAFTHAGMNDFYGLAVNSNSATSSNAGSSTTTTSVKKFSFGSGLNGTVAAGVMFNRNIGLELGVTGIIGPERYHSDQTISSNIASTTFNYTTYAKTSIAVVPAIVLSAPAGKVDIYSRLGLAIPVAGKIIVEGESSSSLGGTEESRVEVTNRFSLGMTGALGFNYHVSRSMGLWLEVNGVSRNAFAKKLEFTRYRENGVDRLSTLSTRDRITEFDSELTQTSGAPNTNVPLQAQTFAIPYSNIGFGVGVTFNL